jgi:hypothetical protein
MNGFQKWSQRHLALFGLTEDTQAAVSIAALEHVFDLAGFAIEELDRATDHLAVHAPKLELPEHRVALRDAVLRGRAEAHARAESQADYDRGRCILCGGTGVVVVPHPQSVTGSVWDGLETAGFRYTAGVACSCFAGRRRYDQSGQETGNGHRLPKLMSLGDYEKANPHWKEQMELKTAELQAGAKADQLARPRKGKGKVKV